MRRIELTRKDERILPVNVNGKDIDLTFDAGSLETKNAIVSMLDDIFQYRERGTKMFGDSPKKNDVKAIAEVRKFTNDGIELCKNLSARFGAIFPAWGASVGDNFISLEVYGELLGAMMEVITDKETEDKVAEDIESER